MHKGTPRLGDQVVELHDVTIGYDHETPLVTGLDLLLGRRSASASSAPTAPGSRPCSM